MRTSATVVLVALTLGAALGAGHLTAMAPATPHAETAKPAYLEYLGADGKITTPQFVRITDSDAWLSLWSHHTGLDKEKLNWSGAYPKIDFTRCMAVAYFRGNSNNTRGEELQAVDEVDGKLRLRFCTSGYQSMSLKGEDHGVDVVSYGIWILPRSTKAIDIEENVQGLIGKAPIWKQQSKLDALKD